MYTAFLRKYIPIKWPEQKPESHTHEEEEEEEDKPITITIKKEELATSIQELLDTMNEEGKEAIDGIPLDHILEVLTAAREMLEEEMAHQTCPVSAADFAIKDAEKPAEKSEAKSVEEKPEEKPVEEKEEEWHVSGMTLPFAFIPEEKETPAEKPAEVPKPEEKVEEKPVEAKPEEKPEEPEVVEVKPEPAEPVKEESEEPEVVEVKPEEKVEEKPVEEKPEEKPAEKEEKDEEWRIRTAPWALEEYPAPEPSVDWPHVAALLQQAKHLLSPAETPATETPVIKTPAETAATEAAPETPATDTIPETTPEATPETPTPAEAPIDWEHATALLREARVLALQEKVASLQAEKAGLETALEAEKAKAAQEEMEKAKAALAVLEAAKEKEVEEAEATFTESFEQAAAQEKAAEVARVLETYRAEVKKHQTAYIEKLDDYVYAREMAVKGHFLAEEEKLNERWAQRLAREVANVAAEAQEEKEEKEAELAALQDRVEALLEEMKAQEGVLRRAIRVQEYQQLLVTIQSRLLRQENVLPQLAQLVGATRRREA